MSQDYYVVRASAGDTYMSLAWEHNVSPYDVVTLNKVKAPYRLQPGDLVRIPMPRIHVVRRGDTLLKIARSYHVGFYDLAQANAINTPYTIYPGQVLRLPAKHPIFESRPKPPVFASGPPSWDSATSLESRAPFLDFSPDTPPATNPSSNPPPVASAEPSTAAPPTPKPTSVPTPTPKPSSVPAPTPKPPQLQSPEPAPAPATVTTLAAAASPPPRVPEQVIGRKPRPKPPSIAKNEPSGQQLLWPVKGRVISDFGPTSNGRHNDGINIAVPTGTPVRAAADGIVIYRGNEVPGFGNLVLIRHDDDLVTAYAHISAFRVEKGERVRRGQLIALSGSTGNVDEPQLHFEVRRGVKAVDPRPHLTA